MVNTLPLLLQFSREYAQNISPSFFFLPSSKKGHLMRSVAPSVSKRDMSAQKTALAGLLRTQNTLLSFNFGHKRWSAPLKYVAVGK